MISTSVRPPLQHHLKCCGSRAGAVHLMQLQTNLKRQIEEGKMEQGVEAYLESNKDVMVDNLWKLNVADIENTLTRVCQRVPTCLKHRLSSLCV